jgi:precorrin-6A/cobalt-precorrin-6A reductase
LRLLILGGTTEASALARLLADEPRIAPVLSLAGRTKNPVLPPIAHRIGGFGGVEGLAWYLSEERVKLLVDATHPFAARITPNAVEAARIAGVPLLRLERPGWTPRDGDDWHPVSSMAEAALALGDAPRRVFLTIGRQDLIPFRDLAAQHAYLIRSVDAPEAALLPPRARLITARGPFAETAERALLTDNRIEFLVTKNSGGADAKLAAARHLGLSVIMVDRAPALPGARVETAEAAMKWILSHGARTDRGA